MKGLPYFRWYPADAETDANFRAMSDAEIGFYVRCLNHAWINGGIPADPVERARVLHTRLDTANNHWFRVGKCFVPSPNDPHILVNPRAETERRLASQKSQMAMKSANVRYERSANAPRHALARADSDSDSGFGFPGGAGGDGDIADFCDRIYARHPKKKDLALLPAAAEAAVRVRPMEEIERTHAAWCETEDWTKSNGRFAPSLAAWLNDRGYIQVPRKEMSLTERMIAKEKAEMKNGHG